ncbi:MAG TPA: hypothetical protein VN709_09685 [Terriglobales bacterium]|nr:hypothetical protein [Terriglobales bacterium]
MTIFPILLGTFAASVAATAAVRAFAPRLGAVAPPRADRWHRKPTALLGGVAMAVALALGLFLAPAHLPGFWPLLAGTGLLFVVGLVDDLHTIKPYSKLVFQIGAATIMIGAHWVLPWTQYNVANQLITLFWLVGVTNAFNLLDNMDGLAAGIALCAALFQGADLLLNGQPATAMLPLLLAASIAGFLVFNFPPASIFMGDCGSLGIGFFLAGSCLLSNWQRSRGLSAVLVAPVLIMLVPIADTTLVTIVRKFHGRRASQGGRDHSSHRLVALGLSERGAVLFLYAISIASGSVALLLRYTGNAVLYFVGPCVGLAAFIVMLRLGMVAVYPEVPSGRRTPLVGLVDFTYKRRMFEVMLDLLLIVLAYYGAFLLRFGSLISGQELAIFHRFVPLVMAMEIAAFLACGLYRGLWHYTGIEDLATILGSVLTAAGSSAALILLLQRGPRLSLAVLALNGILLLLLVAGSRVSQRLLGTWLIQRSDRESKSRTPVVIYGAGVRGELLARDLLSTPEFYPVAFVDDDARKVGRTLRGVHIYAVRDLEKLRKNYGIGQVFVSSGRIPEARVAALGLVTHRPATPPGVAAAAAAGAAGTRAS